MKNEKPIPNSSPLLFRDSVRSGALFVDAASNTLLPRLRELRYPHSLQQDDAIVELLEMMFPAEGAVVGSEWTRDQLESLIVTLPDALLELKRLEFKDFEPMRIRIRDFVLLAQSALDRLELAAQRAHVMDTIRGE